MGNKFCREVDRCLITTIKITKKNRYALKIGKITIWENTPEIMIIK